MIGHYSFDVFEAKWMKKVFNFFANWIVRAIHVVPIAPDKKRDLLLKIMARLSEMPTAYGPVIRTDLQDFTNCSCVTGHYGTELSDLIKAMPKNGVFLDVGANCGIYSLVAAAHLTKGKVYSFEPSGQMFKKLIINLGLNRAFNVHPLNFGMSTQAQFCWATFDTSHTGASHIVNETSQNWAQQPFVLLGREQIRTLIKIPHNRDVFCKIDTEGSEYASIVAMQEAGLLEKIKTLYVEINNEHLMAQGSNVNMLYDYLEEQSFKPKKGRDTNLHFDEIFERAGVSAVGV